MLANLLPVSGFAPCLATESSVSTGNAFLALAIGMAIVLGMILLLKTNAFLAMITAAIAVSFTAAASTGLQGDELSRVAVAFGVTAEKVGILIACAAIIGKCLMESGAADRVVQSAVNLTGTKRAPWALTGSGFVLSIPVFFDTVFFLLVPLARSLYRRTEKNYLLYLCAIAAGGAITHTLVPPTPGPLLMAAALDVNVGLMILVGGVVAIPAAIVAVLVSMVIDRKVAVPFREIASTTELADPDGAWEESEAGGRPLPGLFVSLLPILLPVALIGVNTAVETLQTEERRPQYDEARAAVQAATETELDNAVAAGETFTSVERARAVEAAINADVAKLNTYPTSYDGLHRYTSIFGDPDFALLLATAISMWLLWSATECTRAKVGEHVENALMSGGVIILITAAGGAFGGMLKVAGVGDAIKVIAEEREATGLVLLLVAWGVAAVMKVAQGSSTTAMITVSGIFSGGFVSAGVLPFNPVYLCTAIGAGSLMGSWMNDSGFWVFTKMGGLTETESLKSWTIVLAVLSVTAIAATMVLATVLPMAS